MAEGGSEISLLSAEGESGSLAEACRKHYPKTAVEAYLGALSTVPSSRGDESHKGYFLGCDECVW